jgi:cytochrome c-type biogenesis protein CcmH
MSVFWVLAVILLIVAYSLFVPPLVNKARQGISDRKRLNLLIHAQRRRELEQEYAELGERQADCRNLTAELDKDLLCDLSSTQEVDRQSPVEGRWVVVVALILCPWVGFILYTGLGRMDLLDERQAVSDQKPDERMKTDIQAGIQQLAKRLEADPNDLQSWLLLGRSLQAIGQPQRAVTAYEFAQKLAPNDLDIKAFYAQALAEANHDRLEGKPAEIIGSILAADPQHKTGLWLAGLAAAERGNTAEAVDYWQRLKGQFQEDSDEARQLTAYIAQVQTGSATTETQAPRAEKSGPKRIQVTVTLAENLQRQASATDTVFIFARAAKGPPMPLAIARKQVRDLPVRVTLDDSMAMAPGMNLSSFETVIIGARVSKTGNAMPSPGDLQGLSEPIQTAANAEYRVQIDQIVP